MRIAITGHTAGIGQALAHEWHQRGHEITGISTRTGHDIKQIQPTADIIEPCDWFVNNAQDQWAQTDLLYEMARRWQGSGRTIVNISTQMTQTQRCLEPGLEQYWLQKVTLEQAVRDLRSRDLRIRFITVRPGDIATHAHKTVPPAADVVNWAQTLVQALDLAHSRGLWIDDITLGPAYGP